MIQEVCVTTTNTGAIVTPTTASNPLQNRSTISGIFTNTVWVIDSTSERIKDFVYFLSSSSNYITTLIHNIIHYSPALPPSSQRAVTPNDVEKTVQKAYTLLEQAKKALIYTEKRTLNSFIDYLLQRNTSLINAINALHSDSTATLTRELTAYQTRFARSSEEITMCSNTEEIQVLLSEYKRFLAALEPKITAAYKAIPNSAQKQQLKTLLQSFFQDIKRNLRDLSMVNSSHNGVSFKSYTGAYLHQLQCNVIDASFPVAYRS